MPPVPPAKPEFPKFVDSLWCVYIVSVVAAWNAEIITYPLDLIKTRLQIQGELNKNGGKTQYRGMFKTAVGIASEEGVHKLWQGVHAAFARHLIYSGTRIMSYKALKENAFKHTDTQHFPLWKSAICGVTAGAFAQYIASPTDLLKVQLQMEGRRRLMGKPPRVNGMWDAFKKVWTKGGVRGLWKGSVPNLQRAALVNLGDLTTYDLAKRFIMDHTSLPDNHLVHIMASSCAGFVAASMGTPADVIKTRVMNQPVDEKGSFTLWVPLWSETSGKIFLVLRMGTILDQHHTLENNNNSKNTCLKVKKSLVKRLPLLEWLPRYTRGDIIADFIAGLTVGMTMIPQSIAYAGLAGLNPQYGLYTSFMGSFAYVFFGTIKEVSIGPTSLMALLTFSYGHGNTDCVMLLTLLVGIVEFLMGVFKTGFIMDFISPGVTSGFTSASSIIIIVAQLKNFFGVKIKNHDTFPALREFFSQIKDIKLADTALGIVCIASLICFKKLNQVKADNETKRKLFWFLSISKNAITVLVCSIIAFIVKHFTGSTPFALTGHVPSGLPSFEPPPFHAKVGNETVGFLGMIQEVGSGIIVIPVVAILANIAIAKAYSADTVVDASQEMISLGLCNIFGSFVQAMPSCGAFTRSAVASSSGVRTPLQGVYAGAVIMLALSFLAPLFMYIPKATLGAVLITAAWSLIDYEILGVLWKCKKVDCFMTVLTFVIGIVLSVELSIVMGAFINGLFLLKAWSRPKTDVVVRTDGKTEDFLYVRPEIGLFYPASDYLTETIKKAHQVTPSIPIVLDFASIIEVDYAAVKTVENLINTFNKKHIVVVLVNVNEDVMKTIKSVVDVKKLSICKNMDSLLFEKTPEREPLIIKIEERTMVDMEQATRRGSLRDVE